MGFTDVFTVVWFLGLIAVIAAGVRTFAPLRNLLRGVRSASWPTAPGEVVVSAVRSERIWSGNRTRRVYLPDVVYVYRVLDRDYQSDAVAVRPVRSAFSGPVQRIVDDHPVGARVQVHVHPERAAESVLIPGVRAGDFAELAGNLLAGVIGLAAMSFATNLGADPSALSRWFGSLLGFMP